MFFRTVIFLLGIVGLFGVSACPLGVDRTMMLIHGAVPIDAESGCEFQIPTESAQYLTKGVLELSVGQTEADYVIAVHMSFPFSDVALQENEAFPNYGKTQTANNVSLREAEFLIETEAELIARLEADTEFDWDTITQTQEPLFVPLPLTSNAGTGDFLAPMTLPLENLVVPPIVGDKTQLMIHLVMRGQTVDGDSLESSVFHFPIDICNGCLSNPTCPVGTTAVPVSETPCVVGQDFPLVVCRVAGDEEG